MAVQGKGNIRLEVEGLPQVVTDVYYVPNLTNNLLSIGQLQEKQLTIVIENGVCKIYHHIRGLIAKSKMTINLMFLLFAKKKPRSEVCLKMEEEDFGDTMEKKVWTSQQQVHSSHAEDRDGKGIAMLKVEIRV